MKYLMRKDTLDQKKKFPYCKKLKIKLGDLALLYVRDLWVNKDIEGRGIHKKILFDLKKKS